MTDRDLYDVLGVSRSASADEIKSAYRKLARQYHPDLNPNDKKNAEQRFREIQEAYDVLGDSEKRKQYDMYGRAAFEGVGAGPRAGASEWTAHQAGPGGFETFDFSQFFNTGGGRGGARVDPADLEEGAGLFDELFGRMRSGRRPRSGGRPGRDIESSLRVPFLTAVKGGEMPIVVSRPTGQHETLDVKIPPGIADGAKIRLKGKGEPGTLGGPDGSLVITVHVEPHPYFRREGRNLVIDVPITIGEAVLGARIEVPTLEGLKTVTVPPGSSGGQKLRIKGQGVPADGKNPAGDLLAVLKIVAPKQVDDESRRLIEGFARRNPAQPRRGLWST